MSKNQSETISNIFAAFIKAQAEFTNPKKNSDGYGYKYVELDAIVDMVRPVLAKHGLGFIQTESSKKGEIGMQTTLIHSSGEWIKSETIYTRVPEIRGTNYVQKLGGAITYLRRYQLGTFLGIISEKDDDAHGLGTPAAQAPVVELSTEEQRKDIMRLAELTNKVEILEKEDLTSYTKKKAQLVIEKMLKELEANG